MSRIPDCPKTYPILMVCLIAFAMAAGSEAADQVVTTNADSGAGSLRQAILDIESGGADGDTITFNLSAGNETITIGSQFGLIWQKNFIVDGDNTAGSGTNVTVQVTTPGVSPFRIFEIRPYSGTHTLKNLTLRGGNVTDGGGAVKVHSGDATGNLVLENVTISDSAANYGGGVYAWGTMGSLTVTDSVFQNNSATSASPYGGGAIFMRSLNGPITITGSTFDGNTSNYYGGAIEIYDEAFSIDKSSFSNNTATNSGGAIYVSGVNSPTTSSISNSTFSGNTAGPSGSNNFGGGIYYYYGVHEITNSTFSGNTAQIGAGIAFSYATLYLTNATVANNTTTALGGGLYHGSGAASMLHIKNTILANNGAQDFNLENGSVTDNGYNIVENSTNYAWTATGDITGDQINLNLSATLADNAGLNGTQTLALATGSVAIDAGDNAANSGVSVPANDQRDLGRLGTVDIGAYEFGGVGNAAPVAVDDSETTTVDTILVTGNVLDNDTDANPLDTLSVSAADTASVEGGTVTNNNDGTFQYLPPVGFTGTDSFDYTVSDGNGGADTGTVSITVDPEAGRSGNGSSLGPAQILFMLALLAIARSRRTRL